MGRSVSVASNAAVVVYTTFESSDPDGYEDFQWLIKDLRQKLHKAFPSVSDDDRWLDNEDHVIASNHYADFGLSEYCGLVSVWIVPRDDNLAENWINQIEARFRSIVRNVFGAELRKMGVMSNGEAVFQAKE